VAALKAEPCSGRSGSSEIGAACQPIANSKNAAISLIEIEEAGDRSTRAI